MSRNRESWDRAWADLERFVSMHNKPVWLVPTPDGHQISVITPRPDELPAGTSACQYNSNLEVIDQCDAATDSVPLLLPLTLPAGWQAERDEIFGVIITGVDADGAQGFVTVSEKKRGFELGVNLLQTKGAYTGRRWQERLYADAVAALKQALRRE